MGRCGRSHPITSYYNINNVFTIKITFSKYKVTRTYLELLLDITEYGKFIADIHWRCFSNWETHRQCFGNVSATNMTRLCDFFSMPWRNNASNRVHLGDHAMEIGKI